MASSNVTLSDLERSKSRSLGFERLKCAGISCKGSELSHVLLLNINRKPYMGIPKPLSHLTLSDLERSK